MSDKQPPTIIVQYHEHEAPKRGWNAAIVVLCLFFSVAMCGQCSRWIGY